jgi:hypothetical protein
MLASTSIRKCSRVALLALGVVGCSDGPMSPTGIAPASSAPLMASGSGSGGGGSSGSRAFVVRPGQAVDERFGDHVLRMPANIICDPATSGYQPTLWDQPCAPIRHSVEITATWSTIKDRPVISFSPDLRFVPSRDEKRWVSLSLKDTRGIDPDRYYTILWYDAAAQVWIDESLSDPTLKARTDQSGNMVTRRLKHFSDYLLESYFGSYNVTSG